MRLRRRKRRRRRGVLASIKHLQIRLCWPATTFVFPQPQFRSLVSSIFTPSTCKTCVGADREEEEEEGGGVGFLCASNNRL
jgi:hypothetical protein